LSRIHRITFCGIQFIAFACGTIIAWWARTKEFSNAVYACTTVEASEREMRFFIIMGGSDINCTGIWCFVLIESLDRVVGKYGMGHGVPGYGWYLHT